MFDILATICLLHDPETCAVRTVPVGAETCAKAWELADARLEDWDAHYRLDDVRCGHPDVLPLTFAEVRPGLFVHMAEIALADTANGGDIGNIAFVVGDEAVAVIDAGGSRAIGEDVVAAVRAVTDLPIRVLILTHFHPDHVFGATALVDAGALVVGHERFDDELAARAETYLDRGMLQLGVGLVGTSLPKVDRRVSGRQTLDLGGRVLELQAWPVGHSEADVSVYDRESGTLLAGDLIFDRHVPALDGSLSGWIEVLDMMAEIGATHVVPGHGGPVLPWPGGGDAVERYLEALTRDTRVLLREGATINEASQAAAADERDHWLLFDLHNPRNATVAYTELEWE